MQRQLDPVRWIDIETPEAFQHVAYVVQRRIDGLNSTSTRCVRRVGRDHFQRFVPATHDQLVPKGICRVLIAISRLGSPFDERSWPNARRDMQVTAFRLGRTLAASHLETLPPDENLANSPICFGGVR